MLLTPENIQLAARLLLLSAPASTLADLDLTQANQEAWCGQLMGASRRAAFSAVEMLALALFHANRTAVNFRRCRSLLIDAHIPPEVLRALVQLAMTEESTSTQTTMEELSVQTASRKGQAAVRERHNKKNSRHQEVEQASQLIRATWMSGKYATRNICAEEEHDSLGLPFDTARKALRNTPDPDPWPGKEALKQQTSKP